MKTIKYLIVLMTLCALTTSCFEVYEDRYLFTDSLVEFQNAVVSNNATGRSYPLINQRSVGVVNYQVNLIGGHLPESQTINYRIVESESNAIEGVHYNIDNEGTFIIPSDSSFGFLEVQRLAFERQGSTNYILVIELLGNNQVAPSNNHKTIGLSF
ncbi:DUF4843 domain-containing protein [Belliella sp. R4-6]|uniref:DUF4843 domain-containing protein n=1 Tax=Belliella alkalica TaxID=1730871 RepID=A0ABS9VFL6_9BACT|nr:DUF4843 domain-containing protein [Belliella alkalica]MCH7415233.1 DUF4843 domain-containing protein [Belliella alkalica]